MQRSEERLKVIENIKINVANNELNKKVEINDPVVDKKELDKALMNFDITKNNIVSRYKRKMARKIANNYTKLFNYDTKIIGLENLQEVKTGAIITSNHFSPKDSTVIMYAMNKIGKREHMDIVIEEENTMMTGQFGFLMNNCGTIPLSKSKLYMEKKFMPAVETLLKNKDFILIYPEEQMWYNYRKPRPLKPGAYHLAAKFNVPVIPCFTEIRTRKDYDEDGFKKLKFILHIMKPIYPDPEKTLKQNKEEMQKKDYEAKISAYEDAYGKKLDYTFEQSDIAGFE